MARCLRVHYVHYSTCIRVCAHTEYFAGERFKYLPPLCRRYRASALQHVRGRAPASGSFDAKAICMACCLLSSFSFSSSLFSSHVVLDALFLAHVLPCILVACSSASRMASNSARSAARHPSRPGGLVAQRRALRSRVSCRWPTRARIRVRAAAPAVAVAAPTGGAGRGSTQWCSRVRTTRVCTASRSSFTSAWRTRAFATRWPPCRAITTRSSGRPLPRLRGAPFLFYSLLLLLFSIRTCTHAVQYTFHCTSHLVASRRVALRWASIQRLFFLCVIRPAISIRSILGMYSRRGRGGLNRLSAGGQCT